MNKIKLFVSALLILLPTLGTSAAEIWYNRAANEWMEAMPIGNGRLSGMVYGGTGVERVALNEISMWSGQPDMTSNYLCGRDFLDDMRRLFFEGNLAEAQALGDKVLQGRMTSFGTHVPIGDLTIDFGHTDGVKGYSRRVDMTKAVATVKYDCGGVAYKREYIANYPDDVMALRCSASKKGVLTAKIGFDLLRKADIVAQGNEISFSGKVDFPMHGPGGVMFFGSLRVEAKGGSVEARNDTLYIKGADEFVAIVDVRTDYNKTNYEQLCRETIEKAMAKGFHALMKTHVADYSNLYNRMTISLGDDKYKNVPTDERLAAIKKGRRDPAFDAIFFQYGRYMLISSSRKTDMPLCANLQGIWNDNGACNMPWTCDYHLDMNIQQNYWSANRVNLAECNEPLFDYLGLLAKHGRETARKMYGCGGWVAHTVCNAWGYTAPGWGVSWGMNVTGGAWLATHLWSHYQYTSDNDYLRNTAYPILREAARFFSDYMVEEPKTGYLLTGPSVSPENGYIGPDNRHYSLAMMPTMDRVMVYDIFESCIKSAEILGIDDEFTAKLKKQIAQLPPLQIDERGMLQEWYAPVKRADESHRHSSHVHALFPYNQISFTRTPELAEACRKSITVQTSDPSWEDTEWSTANMLCFNARLKDGDTAYGWLQNLFKRFTRENLMTVSPAGVAMAEYDIFSFDATEGAVAGMCEMLMQCQDGEIVFLPALPKEWQEGQVKGLCAYDGLVIDMEWKNGRMKSAAITSTVKDTSVKLGGRDGRLNIKKGKTVRVKY